jgi:peptide/nickel transport system permease protein
VVIFIIVLANWPYVARIIRGQVLSMREKEFVEASRSLGASNTADRLPRDPAEPRRADPRLLDALHPANILLEAALSFLGVGVQPPDPSWGKMLADAASVFDTAWWFMFFPAWPCCSPSWRSTWSATGCRTRSIPRARATDDAP